MSTVTQTRTQTDRTVAPAGGTAYPEIVDVRPLGFGRLVSTEMRKMIDTRSGRWLIVVIVGLTALALAGTMWLNREDGARLFDLLLAANLPQTMLLPILGVMTAANEWSQRTALITFTQEPRRVRVMMAKTVAALVLGLTVLAAGVLLAFLAHLASVGLAGGELDLKVAAPFVVGSLIVHVLGLLTGVGLGALLLNIPLAITAYFAIPTLLPVVTMLTSWLREHAAWIDPVTAQIPLLNDRWPTVTQWEQVAVTSAVWVLLPLVLGIWRVARREVK